VERLKAREPNLPEWHGSIKSKIKKDLLALVEKIEMAKMLRLTLMIFMMKLIEM